MNTAAKKFLSAILTAAIVFSQAGAAVCAADSDTFWDTKPGNNKSTVVNTTAKRKNFNNNTNFMKVKDKYGNYYPWSYYFYAQDEASEKLYVRWYETIYERKDHIYNGDLNAVSVYNNMSGRMNIVGVIENDLQYLFPGLNVIANSDGQGGYNIRYETNNDLQKVLNDFDKYLEKNNVTSTEDFLFSINAYLSENVEYHSEAAKVKGARFNVKYIHCCDKIGALVKGKALRDGYADAFRFLCGAYGVPCSLRDEITKSGDEYAILPIAMCNNVWYNFDPYSNKSKRRQMITDKQLIDIGTKKIIETNMMACNGKAVAPQEISYDYVIMDFNLVRQPTYGEFEKLMLNAAERVSISKASTVKINVPKSEINTVKSYIKKMKANGKLSYTKLVTGKNYIKVTLKT